MNKVLEINAYPQVVYSHFIERGMSRMKELLEKKNASLVINVITGSTPNSKRDSIVKAYNQKKVDVLFFTDAAKEGIDLHGSRAIHITEPHVNLQMERQTINRVIRYDSHKNEENKNIKVFKYVSVFPQRKPDKREGNLLWTLFVENYYLTKGSRASKSTVD